MNLFISVDTSMDDHHWWQKLLFSSARIGDPFEIHCWYDETDLIRLTESHGSRARSSIPEITVVSGVITEELLHLLKSDQKPEDSSGYHKMTPFYTVRIGEGFSSEQYGTEIYLTCDSEDQFRQVEMVLDEVKNHANIYRNP